MMEKEEENLWKFKETGDKYSNIIAYNILHKALPAMKNNSIKELADVVFDYRFTMGSIENCSFVHEDMIEEGKQLRELYEDGLCEFLALSSVGPAYFIIVNDDEKKEKCIKKFKEIGMEIMEILQEMGLVVGHLVIHFLLQLDKIQIYFRQFNLQIIFQHLQMVEHLIR